MSLYVRDAESLLCKYGYNIQYEDSKVELAPQSYICATLEPPGCLTLGFSGSLHRTDLGWKKASGMIYHCDLTSSCGMYCQRPNTVARLLNIDIHDIIGEELTSCNETCCFEHNCNASSRSLYSLKTVYFLSLFITFMSS
ncbi:uncharacterized protein LOC120327774 isoform X2 [Styela clava]|nr:uncharacterized protein LOC120327774 isoform X2 [Styela clava]